LPVALTRKMRTGRARSSVVGSVIAAHRVHSFETLTRTLRTSFQASHRKSDIFHSNSSAATPSSSSSGTGHRSRQGSAVAGLAPHPLAGCAFTAALQIHVDPTRPGFGSCNARRHRLALILCSALMCCFHHCVFPRPLSSLHFQATIYAAFHLKHPFAQ
jgi:hypothetical protein